MEFPIYAFATIFGRTTRVSPESTNASSTRIIATRSSDYQGKTADPSENWRESLVELKTKKIPGGAWT